MYDQLIEKASKVCYWEIPRSFISINRFSCEKINDIIKVEIPYQSTINTLIERIMRIDEKMNIKSRDGYRIWKEPVEVQLND
jgi:hypothetical protein